MKITYEWETDDIEVGKRVVYANHIYFIVYVSGNWGLIKCASGSCIGSASNKNEMKSLLQKMDAKLYMAHETPFDKYESLRP